MSDLPKSIRIDEQGPREGVWLAKRSRAAARKVELINVPSHAGLKWIQVASFVPPRNLPGTADAADVVAAITVDHDYLMHRISVERQGPAARRCSNDCARCIETLFQSPPDQKCSNIAQGRTTLMCGTRGSFRRISAFMFASIDTVRLALACVAGPRASR